MPCSSRQWTTVRPQRRGDSPVRRTPVLGGLFLAGLAVAAAWAEPAQADPLLERRLAAGEFGPAVEAASAVEDVTERIRQLREISSAQRRAGEFRAADETARRIPERAPRAAERGAIVRERSQSGGGSQADFTELIDLITSTVEPESWDEVGGPGSARPYNTGVYVDPNGLMRQWTREEQTGRLEALSRRARVAALNDDLVRPAELRFISLLRLERAVAEQLAAGRAVPETLRRLAGLTQLKHVFFDPQAREIMLAGPAEAWRYDDQGRAVGVESGRPLLDLDDLVVVLRTFAPGGPGLLGCSINTRDANLKSVREFVEASNAAGALRPGQLPRWLKELHARLGLQDVVVDGVPAGTRVAQVMVEADYKMKMIGVEKLDGGPDIPGYFKLLRQNRQISGAPLEALRWWLTMKYDAVLHSSDRTAFELEGGSVLVQSENQFVNAQGKHVPTGIAEPVNRQFAENFTEHYAALCRKEPVFADLKNIFDLALVAALCRQEGFAERAGWDLGVFAASGAYRPAEVPAPRVIDSVIAHRVYGGRDIVVQVAGGVQADIQGLARDPELSRESDQLAVPARRAGLPAGRWWWDAAER